MDIYQTVLRLTDAAVPSLLASQKKDPNHRDYKGLILQGKGFSEPGATASAVSTLLSAYFCPQSQYFKSEVLLISAIDALLFLLSRCHEDGTIDLMETNFHDCTCNAFAVRTLAYTWRLLKREAKTGEEQKALSLIFDFLILSAGAMKNGGFHTPNHRWVMASALSLCSVILPDLECGDAARLYLSEDIDQNEEGDYTERSVSIYDSVCNESLIIIAEELKIPELYVYVERNLAKNLYYIEPDFTGFTMASKRQDYGKNTPVVNHFLSALLLYNHNRNDTALYLAQELLKQMDDMAVFTGPPLLISRSLCHQNLLTRLLLYPSLSEQIPTSILKPVCYEKVFDLAGIVRCRNNRFSLTLIRDNSAFIKIQNGCLKAYIKLAGSFFAKGRMLTQTILKIDGGYRLLYETERGYFLPIKNRHEKNFENINYNERTQVNIQYLKYQIDVYPAETGASLHISSEGTQNVPIKLEFIFEEGGTLYTGHTVYPGLSGGYAIVGENFTYDRCGEKLEIDGGFNLHEYAPEMRGSDPMPPNSFCVYFTGFTPLDAKIKIKAPPYIV